LKTGLFMSQFTGSGPSAVNRANQPHPPAVGKFLPPKRAALRLFGKRKFPQRAGGSAGSPFPPAPHKKTGSPQVEKFSFSTRATHRRAFPPRAFSGRDGRRPFEKKLVSIKEKNLKNRNPTWVFGPPLPKLRGQIVEWFRFFLPAGHNFRSGKKAFGLPGASFGEFLGPRPAIFFFVFLGGGGGRLDDDVSLYPGRQVFTPTEGAVVLLGQRMGHRSSRGRADGGWKYHTLLANSGAQNKHKKPKGRFGPGEAAGGG